MSKVFRNSENAKVSFSENAFGPAYIPEHGSGDDPTSEKIKNSPKWNRKYSEGLIVTVLNVSIYHKITFEITEMGSKCSSASMTMNE